MLRKSLIVGMFVAAMMVLSQGSPAYAAKGQKVPQSPCAFMQDIDKRITVNEFGDFDCVLCRCVLKGVEQDVFRINFIIDAPDGASISNGECDDSDGQINDVHVDVTRWVRVEKDPQNPCIRGKEDVNMRLTHDGRDIFKGKGVGVVGVGNPLKGELCCNFDRNQAVIHLTGIGHNDFGGPAPKKKCWARVKYISQINPSDHDNPCSINSISPDFPAHIVINGVEGCICDSTFQTTPD